MAGVVEEGKRDMKRKKKQSEIRKFMFLIRVEIRRFFWCFIDVKV